MNLWPVDLISPWQISSMTGYDPSNPFVEAELCQTVSGHFLEELLLAAEFFSAAAFRVLAKSNGLWDGSNFATPCSSIWRVSIFPKMAGSPINHACSLGFPYKSSICHRVFRS